MSWTRYAVVLLLGCGSSATPSESPSEATSAASVEPNPDEAPLVSDNPSPDNELLWADPRVDAEGGGWPEVGLPFGDTSVRVSDDYVEVARLGMPPSSIDSWDARRLAARRIAEDRARASLVAWVEEQLGDAPEEARALLQDVASDRFEVIRTRSLVDGAAVLVCGVPRAALNAAAELEQTPW